MAAPLETLDQIRDALISRGIGTSGLTTQAIQRANLPELRTELATATAIRQAEEQAREQKFKAQQLKSLAGIQQSLTRTTEPEKFLKVGVGANQQPFISGVQGIGGAFVTSGQIPQFAQDIKNILAGTGGGVQIEKPTGNPTLDNLLLQLRSMLNIAGARVI